MNRLLLILCLISGLCFADTNPYVIGVPITQGGVTYISQIPCSDNAANTVVTNNGTGSDWVSDSNTDAIYSTTDLDGTGNSFYFDASSNGIQSADNLTTEKFEAKFYYQWSDPSVKDNEEIWSINGSGLSSPNNSITIFKPSSASTLRLVTQDNVGGTNTWNSTNFVEDGNTHLITVTVDASSGFQSVVVKQGTTTITWDSSAYPAGAVIFNGLENLGSFGSFEPQAYITGYTLQDLE